MFPRWPRWTRDMLWSRIGCTQPTELTGETWTWLLVAVGVILRLLEYADNRQLYMDERSLLENLVGLPVFDFTHDLDRRSACAAGFPRRRAADGPAATPGYAGRPAGSAPVRHRLDVPDAFGRPPLSHAPRRPDRGGAFRPGRLAALLLGRDQAV